MEADASWIARTKTNTRWTSRYGRKPLQPTLRWPSPWGDGFPGWHIECTVMSTKYLGGNVRTIHIDGGMDLRCLYHECEIALAVKRARQEPRKLLAALEPAYRKRPEDE